MAVPPLDLLLDRAEPGGKVYPVEALLDLLEALFDVAHFTFSSYWMSGIVSQYTAFEKVEIQTAICTSESTYWKIAIKLKNSGTKAATLTNVFVNNGETAYATTPTGGTAIEADLGPGTGQTKQIVSGASDTVPVWIGNTGTLTAGTTVNIKIHSAGGMDYIKLVELV